MDEIQQIISRINIPASTNQNSSPKYSCPICKDTGSIKYLEPDEYFPGETVERWGDCECVKARRLQERYERAGIAKAFANCTFDNFTTDKKPEVIKAAKKVAQGYVNSFDGRHSIALLGQVGSGKTHLCTAITNELLKKFVAVLYMPYREAVTLLKQSMTKNKDEDESIYQREIQKYKSAPVLYIDDLFKGKLTDSDKNIMFEIINYRYQSVKPIIVSSEFTTEKLLDFDEAIGSRIIQMCIGYIVELHGLELNHRLSV